MRHLSEGELRRYYDDPDTIVTAERAHFASCPVCQDRLKAVAGDAVRAHALLEVPAVAVDAEAALTTFRAEHEPARRRARSGFAFGLPRMHWQTPAIAAGLAAALVVMFTLTPFAGSLRQLFQPTQVQPVALSQQDLGSLAPLHSYGTVKVQQKPAEQTAASAAAAAQASGLPAIHVGSVPSTVAGQSQSYYSMNQSSASFTFSEAKATAAAAKAGRPAPSFPAGVDGSALVVQSGPGEALVYGDVSKLQQAAQQGDSAQKSSQSQGSAQSAAEQAAAAAGPFLVAGQMRAPVVSSTGISVDQLKQVLLSEPGLTAQAKQLIQGLGSPTGALPIPIPSEYGTAQQVTVQGVSGEAFGDNTGLGSGVVWIKGGVVYFVGGTISEQDALAVAQTLR
ncbi:MAG: hypothetical protein WAM30_09435 [Candidatus Dormiibacterota bacterium]